MKFVVNSIGDFAVSADKILNVLVGSIASMYMGEYYGFPVKIIDLSNETVVMGVYKSREKAKKVMEDIMLFCVQEYEEYEQRILEVPPSEKVERTKTEEVAE